jgi:protease-4
VRESVYARLFDTIARGKRYRALLLDINSPGGSATGSDLMYHSLQNVARQKPVVAYVSGVGASGGYYLCCAASKVVALPAALVGSIGVIYLRPILEQLLDKVGIELSVFKGGRLKDMTGFWRSPTDEESAKFQGLIGEMYDTFVSVVAQGRSLEEHQVRELATGELYTARRGHAMGLVDELGDFDPPQTLPVRTVDRTGGQSFAGSGSALLRDAATAGRGNVLRGAFPDAGRVLGNRLMDRCPQC